MLIFCLLIITDLLKGGLKHSFVCIIFFIFKILSHKVLKLLRWGLAVRSLKVYVNLLIITSFRELLHKLLQCFLHCIFIVLVHRIHGIHLSFYLSNCHVLYWKIAMNLRPFFVFRFLKKLLGFESIKILKT